jgi:hypothetical protein
MRSCVPPATTLLEQERQNVVPPLEAVKSRVSSSISSGGR